MYFYEVWVRSNRYHGKDALTYASPLALPVGQLVQVPLQRETVTGFISAQVAKPTFACKPLTAVFALPPLPRPLLQLGAWLQSYYPAPLGVVAQQLVPAGLRLLSNSTLEHTPLAEPSSTELPTLTAEQLSAEAAVTGPNTYLLHGKTGSGKTRLYISLALQAIQAGRSALVLTPEISLTSQLAERFRQVFGDRVLIMHSGLTPLERRTAWEHLLTATEPLIIIGPRSILFSPLTNVGLVILDESHEPAYKQEQAPHYQATRVAARLRELHEAVLVLGSATPSLEDYYLAAARQKPLLTMQQLAISGDQSLQTHIIDLKDRSLFPRSQYISKPLQQAIEQALERGEQTLVYLNRRGTARLIVCENCGWQALCPHCDIPLTYHGDQHSLRCHVCNYTAAPPVVCPDCSKPSVTYKTIGTKAVVDEVQRLFPHARLQRFDTDNLKAERFEQHYEAVKRGDVDILVGTQLLAKGLDLPRLSVLGVVLADTSLHMPDFSASERTYQLLTQVLGRVGRGHVGGQAFLQTYQPDNPVIRDAASADWPSFYERELAERRRYKFPPFYHLLKLSVRRASDAAARKAAEQFAGTLNQPNIIVEGPAPSLHQKIGGKYQYQVVIKAKQRSELLQIIAQLPANWSYDIDPVDLL